jgi:hypothetical protein
MTFSLQRHNLAVMLQRPPPVYCRLHALAFAGTVLGAAPLACADAPLSLEQAEALKTRRTVGEMMRDGIPDISLALIPRQLKVPPGKVSLIPDPADSEGGVIAVYLANGTDRAVIGADWFHAHCFLEVKDGNRWRSCERFIPGCGTGFHMPEPEQLQAGTATLFLGTNPNQGDMTGELRFCVATESNRPIVSESFQGRFSSKRFEEAAPQLPPASRLIVDGLTGKGKKSGDSIDRRIARSPEELIAAAELERSYDESSTTSPARRVQHDESSTTSPARRVQHENAATTSPARRRRHSSAGRQLFLTTEKRSPVATRWRPY